MRIFSIVGARPQFVKLAPLSSCLLSAGHREFIIHTGQHYDYAMSEKIFLDLGIRKPDIHLEINHGNPIEQITRMMLSLSDAMTELKPDLVIVFGDTNSTFAGATSAARLQIPIVHIEAGLRSYNKKMPEELNRVITDHISDYLFAPTQTACDILKTEGLGKITRLTGDIMVDTMKNNLKIAKEKSNIITELKLNNTPEFSLLTLHRNYNVDNPDLLQKLLTQLNDLGEFILFPVHPRTRKVLAQSKNNYAHIKMIDPQGYLDFIMLENASKRIITDSGGIQKESYILQKPCITLRTETEWVETVEEGWNLLINPSSTDIAERIESFKVPETQKDIFGKDVAKKMVDLINQI